MLAAARPSEVLTPDRIRRSTTSTPKSSGMPAPAGSSSFRVTERRRDRRRDSPSAATGDDGPGLRLLAGAAVVAAPLVGSTPISLRPRVRSGRFRSPTTSTRRSSSSRGCRGRSPARWSAHARRRGVVFQGLLRNPLATPFTLGVSAGAALGAMLAITFGWSFAWLGIPAAPLASFAGSLLAVAIVYMLARARHHGLSTNVLLLAGVTMNAFFSALILFVQYFADFAETYRILRWLMGDLDVSSYSPRWRRCRWWSSSFAAFAWLARPLNLLSLGPEAAETRGLDVVRAQRVGLLQRVAGDRRGRVGRRSGRFHRHHRAAPGPADGRAGSPRRAAGVGAVRRGVPRRVRRARAHGDGADRAAGGGDHRAHRRAVLSVVVGGEEMRLLTWVIALVVGVYGGNGGSGGTHHRDRSLLPLQRVATTPRRIISIIPAVTEMLFSIGAGPQVIAVGSFDHYPPEVEKLQRVGALIDPDVERILSLRPDLVAVYRSQADLRVQLERAKIPVYLYSHAALPDITTTIRDLGVRVGRRMKAATVGRLLVVYQLFRILMGILGIRLSGHPVFVRPLVFPMSLGAAESDRTRKNCRESSRG